MHNACTHTCSNKIKFVVYCDFIFTCSSKLHMLASVLTLFCRTQSKLPLTHTIFGLVRVHHDN